MRGLAAAAPRHLARRGSRHELHRGTGRFRSSPGPLGLFAARGGAADQEACGAGQGRPHAGARASPIPATCSARSSSPRRWSRAASSRSSAARWRSISATRRSRDRPGAPRLKPLQRCRAHRRERGRATGTSFAWSPRPSWTPRPGDRTHLAFAALDGASDGLIAAHRRPRRPDRPRHRGRPERPRRRAARPARRRSSGDRLYVELQRHRTAGRGGGRAASPRPRLCPRPAAGRDQRGLLPGPRRLRGA